MKVADKINENLKFRAGACGQSKTVINEATVEIRHDPRVLSSDLLFKVTHEKTGKTGAHAGAHGHTRGLLVMVVVEGE